MDALATSSILGQRGKNNRVFLGFWKHDSQASLCEGRIHGSYVLGDHSKFQWSYVIIAYKHTSQPSIVKKNWTPSKFMANSPLMTWSTQIWDWFFKAKSIIKLTKIITSVLIIFHGFYVGWMRDTLIYNNSHLPVPTYQNYIDWRRMVTLLSKVSAKFSCVTIYNHLSLDLLEF